MVSGLSTDNRKLPVLGLTLIYIYQFPVVKSGVELSGNIEEIYKDQIPPETAETIERILEFRKVRKKE